MKNEQSTANYVWYKNNESYIGEGAFGTVFAGKDRRTGSAVAVKVCRMKQSNEYIEEINTLKDLNSPYIIKYYAAEKVNDSVPAELAIVMELADGTLASELEKQVNRNGISKRTFLVLVDNCVKALQYLHFKKLSHRDIKPPNVLLFRNKEAPTLVFKICDFGSSRLLGARDQPMSTRVGTAAYWPTCILDPTRSDYGIQYTKDEVDIWSTACCFFEAATGRLPFMPRGDRNFYEEMFKLHRGRPPEVVCAQFNEQSGRYTYQAEMPQQHRSYTQCFQDILCIYFRLAFNKDKEYLKLEKFSSLSEEMVSIKEREYYCLNTSTVESYYDTSSSLNFPRKLFLDAIVKVVQKDPGGLDAIRTSATCQKICQALDDDIIEIPIHHAKYKKPLVAVLLPFQLSQNSPHPYCVATLRDAVDGLRLELQDDVCVKAMRKADCTVKQLVDQGSLSHLVSYLNSCTKRTTDAKEEVKLLHSAEKKEDHDAASILSNFRINAKGKPSDSKGGPLQRPYRSAEPQLDYVRSKKVGSKSSSIPKAGLQDTHVKRSLPSVSATKQQKSLTRSAAGGSPSKDSLQIIPTVRERAAAWAQKKSVYVVDSIELAEKQQQRKASQTESMPKTIPPPATSARFSWTNLSCSSEEPSGIEDAWVEVSYPDIDISARYIATKDWTPFGNTFLSSFMVLAASCNSEVMLQRYVDGGADVDAADPLLGWTPVMYAAYEGCLGAVEFFVQNGADILARTMYERCAALHFACKKGHTEIAEYLLDNGADIHALARGKTPLMMAEENGEIATVQLLRSRGARV